MGDIDKKRKEKVPMTEMRKRRKIYDDMKAAVAVAEQKQDDHYKLEAEISALQHEQKISQQNILELQKQLEHEREREIASKKELQLKIPSSEISEGELEKACAVRDELQQSEKDDWKKTMKDCRTAYTNFLQSNNIDLRDFLCLLWVQVSDICVEDKQWNLLLKKRNELIKARSSLEDEHTAVTDPTSNVSP